MIEFKLKPSVDGEAPFIELNKLLKVLQLVPSGAVANQVIIEGRVKLNGKTDLRKRAKIKTNDVVEFDGKQIKIFS